MSEPTMPDSTIRCASCGSRLGHTTTEALAIDEALAQVEALRSGLDRERARADGAEARLAAAGEAHRCQGRTP